MTVNEVIAVHGSGAAESIRVELIRDPDGNFVLIEGSRAGLGFLGNVLLAIAQGPDEDLQLSPNGAGSRYFRSRSKLGMYLRRIR